MTFGAVPAEQTGLIKHDENLNGEKLEMKADLE